MQQKKIKKPQNFLSKEYNYRKLKVIAKVHNYRELKVIPED